VDARDNHNLYALLAGGFPDDRGACALDAGAGLRYSWDDLERASAALATLLAGLALPRGARIAVQVDKSPEALLLYLATLRAGFAYLPLNSAYRASEIDYFVGDAEPSVFVCSPANRAWIEPIARRHRVAHLFTLGDDRSGTLLEAAAGQATRFETVSSGADDLACIVYTSGTTGRSKGAMLSHANIGSNALTLHRYWRWRSGDVLLHMLPIFHVHGLFVAIHGALYSGSKMIWRARFDAGEAVRLLPQASVFMGVPTMYVRLLDEPGFDAQACRNMRLFVSGSAPLLADTFRQFEARTGQRILERYGMSETVMLTSNSCDGNRMAGTVGLPLPGVALRVVDDDGRPCATGEIGAVQVSGPSVFSGYWRMPDRTREEFTADGFFRTGDVGLLDANGYLSIVGRSKDLIITGGLNVYPKEIESCLDEMDGVAESAVFGLPHRDFGEQVAAVVVRKPGAVLDEAELVAALRQRIAAFKVPRSIHVIDELPRNAMGKVQKNLLRERYQRL